MTDAASSQRDPVNEPVDRFELFQLVRLLERAAVREGAAARRAELGEDGPPHAEPVRFRGVVSHRFPKGPTRHDRNGRTEILTAILGLTGPDGVLPRHYTALLVERVRRRDFALRDFLDLLHHRLISLFHRAWRKHRFPVDYEYEAAAGRERDDLFTRCLFALVGYGTPGLRGREDLAETLLLEYAGHFANRRRPAGVLQAMLAERFDVPVEVVEFQPQWLRIDGDARSILPVRTGPGGGRGWTLGRGLGESYNELGVNVVVGDRVRDLQGRFRVQLGPLSYERFRRFAPGGDARQPLLRFVRAFVGPEFEFDLQLLLDPDEVPECGLGAAEGTRLGWDTWVRAEPFTTPRGEAVFPADDG